MFDPSQGLAEIKEETDNQIMEFELYSRIKFGDSKLREETRINLQCVSAFCNLLDVWFRIARFDGEISKRLKGGE